MHVHIHIDRIWHETVMTVTVQLPRLSLSSSLHLHLTQALELEETKQILSPSLDA